MRSTLEPVTKVSELNFKQYTALLWWTSVFTVEPSFTSHTLQEGKCRRYCSIITVRCGCSLPDLTMTPGNPGTWTTLNSGTVVTHHPPITTPPTLSHHTHSLNSHTPIPQLNAHHTSVVQGKYGGVRMGSYPHPPQISSNICFSVVLCPAVHTPGSGVRTAG